jgi:uncharacterized protein YfaS (alpha-2-macroglobulin family)
MLRFRALAHGLVLGSALLPGAATAATVESFSPENVAKNVREVAVRFSEPMVPLGDPRVAEDPFTIDCNAKGTSRWADGRTWVHTFAEDLPAGLQCAFELAPGLKSLAGAAVTGRRRFEFSTGGPAIVSIHPSEDDIAEDQRFAIQLDGEAARDSIERHVFVRVAGLADPIGVRVLDGADREATLKNESTDDWKLDDPRVVVLEARQRFAPEAQVTLHWGEGVAGPTGVALDEEQTFAYEVRTPFGARFSCDRVKAEADCVPLASIRMIFSAPVAWESAAKIVLRGEGDRTWPAQRRYDWDGDALVDAIEFHAPFPPRATLRAEIPAGLADDSGRTLALAKPLELKTDGYPALAKFAARFGVLESASPVLPVTIRHLEADAALRTQGVSGALAARQTTVSGEEPAAILAWLHAVGRSSDDKSVFTMPGLSASPTDVALPKAQPGDDAEVVGIPLSGPGLHVVEIESSILGEVILDPPSPLFVASAALVTNLAVHFKWGNEASLVWVTSLDRGEPVGGVRVRVADCKGAVLAEATTDAQGLAPVAGLPPADGAPSCGGDNGYSDYTNGLLVVAEREGELGLAHTSWSDGIEPWRFELPMEWRPRAWSASTILDRMLFRAGETVHMKHVMRRPVQAGFAQVPPAERPERARIVHMGTLDAWDLPLDFGPGGAAENEWEIPKQAKLGSYEVQIVPKGAPEWDAQVTGTFRVEAFRVPLARGVIQPPSRAVVAASAFPVDVAVQYLAGGGASDAPVTIRSQTKERGTIEFADYPGFAFGTGDLAEGVRTRRFGEHEEAPPAPAIAKELVLDANGTGRAELAVKELETPGPREVQVELEFRDPNGEVQTSSRTIPIWTASRVVGLRNASVRSLKEAVRLESAVVDLEGAPVWLAGVTVDVYRRLSYSSRKRVVGGFYAYEDVEEVKKLGTFCTGRTDRTGRFACEAPPPGAGDLVFVARSSDWLGRASATQTTVYISGDDAWFSQGDGDRMDLLPERPRYEPGETARFSVRMPFREATALVTVEREGVAERFVTKLTASDPTVSVPVAGGHAPNVFVSVLAVRGRALAPPPTATVDLGRPAYRLGVAEIQVGWKGNELAVKVAPERATYKVRETARVRVSVRDASGKAPPQGSEIALAAVDEGLLELMPNRSWKLLEAMMDRRSYAVRTSTAQLQVVGKRHFGRKALPAGGGGGQRPTRELFDTLLLWKGRVALDANGEATVDVPLNDSLTSFRIAAVATGSDGLFGTGEATIRTTQDLMILAGLPQVVREGDRFPAGFTIRNTTDAAQALTLRAKAEGAAPLEPIALELASGESREVSWTVDVPAGAETLPFEIEVTSAAGASDRLRAAPRVVPAVPERILQATLVQVRGTEEVTVERPADAVPDRGGVAVALRPRLADGSDAIERTMREYPYSCLEQQVSVALALRDDARWEAVMENLPVYLDGDGLARFFPGDGPGSEVLTAYVVAVSDDAHRLLPDASRTRMLTALERYVGGTLTTRSPVRGVDGPLRKLAAAEALARFGKATPELLGGIRFTPRELPNASLLDWISILERTPALPGRDAKLAEANRLLRARLSVQGTTLGFAASDAGADWLLATGDVAAARLVLSRLHAPGWRDDAPKLVRAALARQEKGAWATTTANAWGVIALDAFSSEFERAPVSGTTAATLADAKRELTWAPDAKGGVLDLPWPPGASPLALRHTGAGAPWAVVQSVAAVPLRAPFESGYRIERSIEPVKQKTPGVWSRGDVARVKLSIVASSDASWVVASDPIPAGASLLGSGLGGDSALLTAGEQPDSGAAWPAYTERGQEAFRRYYEWVPKGTFGIEYTVRFNQAGRFQLPPTRVEAMYSPEKMGEAPNAVFEVAP